MDKTIDRWTDPDGNGYAFKDTVARAQNRATIDKMNAETADRKSELDIERKRIDNLIATGTAQTQEIGKTIVQTGTSSSYMNMDYLTPDKYYSSLFDGITFKDTDFFYIPSPSGSGAEYVGKLLKPGLYHMKFCVKISKDGGLPEISMRIMLKKGSTTTGEYSELKTEYITFPQISSSKNMRNVEYIFAITEPTYIKIFVTSIADGTGTFGFNASDCTITAIDWMGKQSADLSELHDLRIGADGVVHNTAGEAVRKQIGNLTEDLGDSIYKYQEYDGYVGYDSGTIAELDNVKCTDFLPIKKGMTVKVSGISFEPSDYRGLAIYNKDKIFKNGYQYNKNNEYTFDVSEDGYLRATIVGKQIKVIANQNGIVKALIEVFEDTQKEIKREVNTLISEEYGEEKQLEITEKKEGYAVKSDGSKENAGWISCLKFNCEAHQKIYTKNAHAHKNYPWIVLYDRNNNVIGSVNINEDSSAEIIAPNNVSYGWMNCYELVSYAQTQYLVKTIKNEYLPEKLKKLIIESNPLVNLLENGGYINIFNKIACIGDSLTEGVFEYTENGEVKYAGKPQGFEPYSYPSQLARMTGATVGNYGVGGATAKSWLETTACTDCFKEENKAQAYIIALGTNDTDYSGNVETDIDLSNYNNNVDNFVGNYAKIIQKCLELQPKAKVFVVTIPKTRTDCHNAWTIGNSQIKAIAKKLGVYVLDVYTYSESYDNPDAYKNHFYLGGHRNAIGYRRTAMEYATYISWIIYNNPNDFKNAQFIGMDYEFIN